LCNNRRQNSERHLGAKNDATIQPMRAALLMLLGAIALAAQSRSECVERGRVAVIAHRGAHDAAPENTLASLERAVALGLDFVEADVRTTADGALVILHNSTVDKTTNGHGEVEKLTLEEFRRLRGADGKPLPTLDEMMVAARQRINLYLDVKQAQAEPLVAAIRKHRTLLQTVVMGGDELVAAVRRLDPQVRTMTPAGPRARLDSLIRDVRPTHVEFTRRNFSAEGIAAVRVAGIIPFSSLASGSWDTEEGLRAVLDAGVCAVETDRPEQVKRAIQARRRVAVISHRGANRHAPENTIPAFRRAIELGADFVEIDVRQTADGHLVLMHNPTVDATTDGSGAVAVLNLPEVLRLKIRNRLGPEFDGIIVPTLERVFEELKGKVRFYFDWKQADPEKVAAALNRHGLWGDVVFYGGSEKLVALKKLDRRALPMPEADSPEQIDRLVQALSPTYLAFDRNDFSLAAVRRAHLYGAKVFVDRLGKEDTEAHYRQAIQWGADGIQTDFPDRLAQVLRP